MSRDDAYLLDMLLAARDAVVFLDGLGRDAVAFLHWIPEYDYTKKREFVPGHEPNPAVFDLKAGIAKRMKVRLESGMYVITDLNWSSP
jgi:hypothetical protein